MIRTKLALFALLILPLGFSACLVTSQSDTEYTGKYVSPTTLEQVGVGASQEFVRSALGAPTKETTTDDGVVLWEWAYTRETTKRGSVFLIFSSNDKTRTNGQVFVEFENGRVTKTWSIDA